MRYDSIEMRLRQEEREKFQVERVEKLVARAAELQKELHINSKLAWYLADKELPREPYRPHIDMNQPLC